MEYNTCSFSGHRVIPSASVPTLRDLLRQQIMVLAKQGCTGFLCGGALGFDTLAAEAVITVRARFPDIALTLVLPCPEQSDHWSSWDRARYQSILQDADEVITVSDSYTRFCMMQRNRFLVDHSDILLCWLTEERGGTAATVRYALNQGRKVVNLAVTKSNTEVL